MLDTATIQTVRSHGAAIDRRAFELADGMLNALFAACPHLRSKLTGNRDRQRRALAHRWAWFVRNLGEVERLSPEFQALGSYLSARGFGYQDFLTARTCLLEATRETSRLCDVAWGPMQESGWAAAIDTCLDLMSPAQPVAYAQAA